MPQPLNLVGGSRGTLLLRRQTHTLLHVCPGGVVLKVEQVLCIPGQQSHPSMEVRALEVGHGLKKLVPYAVLLILNQKKRDRQCCSSGEVVLAQEVRAMCAISSTPMMDPDHGSMGSKGIIMLTSRSMPWAVDSRQR
jgi:hypothetical protein